jgi:hypothetical protein
MRLVWPILLCLGVATTGCKPQQGACASMGVSDLLMRAALVRLDVYSGSIGCNGDVIAAGAPAPSQTSVVKPGEAIKLDVPAGRHVLVISAFGDASATQLLGSACSVVTLKADTPACFNLTLTPPLDAGGGTDDAAPACTQSPDDCPVGLMCCSQLCIDSANDADHCGDCARACLATSAAGVATAHCSDSTCQPACLDGFADCGEPAAPAADDGCETNIHTPEHCGGCNTACSLTQATAACPSGTCTIAACNTGFMDCNAKPADGCECPKLGDTNQGCCPSTGANPGACEGTHSDGFSHSFIDCYANGTYNQAVATDAAKAFSASGTPTTGNCSDGAGVTEQVVCMQTTTQCACFTYADNGTGAWVGKARLTVASDMGALSCACPTANSTNVSWR